MCGDHEAAETAEVAEAPFKADATKDFPWHVGAYDAHCHPTDTMASITRIEDMKAQTLTIMATRSQDQDLVSKVAADMGVANKHELHVRSDHNDYDKAKHRAVAAFGWHPWFSHQLYDDSVTEPTYSVSGGRDEKAAKGAHYDAVLSGSPSQSPTFLDCLPTPVPLSSFISQTRRRLQVHPAALVGEVGLDKAFRLPQQWEPDEAASRDASLTPGGREGRLLSPHRVRPQHQRVVLDAQLRLAGEMGRAASVHGVQAHGLLFDVVAACWKGHERELVSRRQRRLTAPNAEPEDESPDNDEDEDDGDRRGSHGTGQPADKGCSQPQPKPFPPRICLHSFSGGPEVLRQWLNPVIPALIFFSFSKVVNHGTDAGVARTEEVVSQVPDDRILIESDLHTAGEDMDRVLANMYREVCRIKAWALEEGVRRIRNNYEKFIFG